MPRSLTRLRNFCLSLPEAHEVEAWGEPTFRVKNKMFAMYAAPGNHHGAGRESVWCKAAPGEQALITVTVGRELVDPARSGTFIGLFDRTLELRPWFHLVDWHC